MLNSQVLSPIGLQLVRSSTLPAEYRTSKNSAATARRIIFFHPPKCGGTSAEKLLEQVFGVGEQLSPFASREASEKLNLSMHDIREILLAYQIHRSDKIFISGHYLYSNRLMIDKQDEFDLITILRDPRYRLLSQYYYNRYKKNKDHFGINEELDEWLNSSNAAYHAQIYTHIFSGYRENTNDNQDKNKPSMTSSATDQAIQNLKSFKIIGILEKPNEFENQIYARYGVKGKLNKERPNPKSGYLTFAEQPNHIQNKITKLCAEDMRLYQTFI